MSTLTSSQIWQYVLRLLPFGAGVLLLVCVWSGLQAGREAAYNEVLVSNGQVLNMGLKNFFSDQDRYPTAGEFLSLQVFGQYVTRMPLEDIPAQGCNASYAYKRPLPVQYELSICLSRKTAGLPQGWSSLQ